MDLAMFTSYAQSLAKQRSIALPKLKRQLTAHAANRCNCLKMFTMKTRQEYKTEQLLKFQNLLNDFRKRGVKFKLRILFVPFIFNVSVFKNIYFYMVLKIEFWRNVDQQHIIQTQEIIFLRDSKHMICKFGMIFGNSAFIYY